MATFETTVPSGRDRRQTFAYMADFRNLAEWDPSVTASVLTAGEAGTPSARYDVTFSLAGHESTLAYETLEVSDDERVVLRAETDAFISLDTIRVVADVDSVRVEYQAAINLKGVRKLADPIADLALTRAGKKAAEGLAARLNSTASDPAERSGR
ncbi:MAG: SRPBCC family protein [Sporichthyaceae bacterium]